jgi:hypothetical protein
MRVFLVGEGRHDIGDLAAEPPYRDGRPGFLQPIVEKLIAGQVEFEGQKVSLLGRVAIPGLHQALERKARIAAQLAEYAESDLLVFIVDLDRGSGTGRQKAASDIKKREKAISMGFQHGVESGLVCAPGIACRTIEAWALGDRVAVGSMTDSGDPVDLPSRKQPEDLWGEPHEPTSNHPKMVLHRLLGRTVTQDDLSEIAGIADIPTMRSTCPMSFEPFAAKLVAVAPT